jgi:cobalt-zinc-cadmium efflux system protein
VALSTTETALTAHLVIPGGHPDDRFLSALAEGIKERFGIGHCTFQVEVDDNCPLEPSHVV